AFEVGVAQAAEGTVDGPSGAIHSFRDLVNLQLLEISEQHDLPLIRRHHTQAGLQRISPGLAMVGKLRDFLSELVEHLLTERKMGAFALAAVAEDLVEGDLPCPGDEIGAGFEL